MTTICRDIEAQAIDAALALLPVAMDTPPARLQLLAIGLQESGLTARCQIVDGGGRGPARGLWQFERGGGVRGVLLHDASRYWAHKLCEARSCPPEAYQVWERLEADDVLAAGLARLLLFTDARRLPAVGDIEGAWGCYVRNWRPGKPHRDRWTSNYAQALQHLQQAA